MTLNFNVSFGLILDQKLFRPGIFEWFLGCKAIQSEFVRVLSDCLEITGISPCAKVKFKDHSKLLQIGSLVRPTGSRTLAQSLGDHSIWSPYLQGITLSMILYLLPRKHRGPDLVLLNSDLI